MNSGASHERIMVYSYCTYLGVRRLIYLVQNQVENS
ncbi:hypothetical protein [Citrobacter phage Ci1]|nr:hypothetical protein [Citrobacter phage Ci1]